MESGCCIQCIISEKRKGLGNMKKSLVEIMENSPIIASVKNEEGFETALKSRCDIVFIQFGTICSIGSLVKRAHENKKVTIVHLDLIDGIANKESSVDYMNEVVGADGIISSRAPVLRAAKMKGMYTVHRFFLIDSMSFHNLAKQYAASSADVVEIMPGCVMPKVFKWVREMIEAPIISSGLICEKEDAISALKNGAIAVSTSGTEVWDAL